MLPATARTRLRGIPLRHVLDRHAFHLGFVFEEVGEAVERPRVQIEIPVRTPVL